MTGKSLLLLVRIKFLKKLLNLAGFKEVSGHWIYYPPINSDSFIIDLNGIAQGAPIKLGLVLNICLRFEK